MGSAPPPGGPDANWPEPANLKTMVLTDCWDYCERHNSRSVDRDANVQFGDTLTIQVLINYTFFFVTAHLLATVAVE